MLKVTLKNCDSKPSKLMREAAETKFNYLKEFIKDGTQIHIKSERVNAYAFKLELFCTLKSDYHCCVEVFDKDYYAGLDLLKDIAKSDISKHQKKMNSKKLKSSCATQLSFDENNDIPLISKRKSFAISSMTEEQATEYMELLGHAFFTFLNADQDDALSILYLRKDGSLGLILSEEEVH